MVDCGGCSGLWGLWSTAVGYGVLRWAVEHCGGLWSAAVGCGALWWIVVAWAVVSCAGHT